MPLLVDMGSLGGKQWQGVNSGGGGVQKDVARLQQRCHGCDFFLTILFSDGAD